MNRHFKQTIKLKIVLHIKRMRIWTECNTYTIHVRYIVYTSIRTKLSPYNQYRNVSVQNYNDNIDYLNLHAFVHKTVNNSVLLHK